MSDPRPGDGKKGTLNKLFHGRSLGPILGPWIACILMAGGVFIFETKLPVFHEVVKIIYFIILVILVIATGRWLSTRQGRRRNVNRRKAERRQREEGQ